MILLHDKMRQHATRVTKEKNLQFGWSVLLHPPQSPDLVPKNYITKLKDEQTAENFFQSKESNLQKKIENFSRKLKKVIENSGEYVIK